MIHIAAPGNEMAAVAGYGIKVDGRAAGYIVEGLGAIGAYRLVATGQVTHLNWAAAFRCHRQRVGPLVLVLVPTT